MAKKKATRIEEIDRNFEPKAAKSSLNWVDAFDSRLALRGFAWPAENRKKKNFRRLPDRQAPGLSEGVQALSLSPAGGFLSFSTDSENLSVRLTVPDLHQMNHMPATGMAGAELYFREGPAWLAAGTVIPSQTETTFTSILLENGPKSLREYRLYLPLYKGLDSLAIGFSPRAKIIPVPAPKGSRPIFFYGTSITQGGCASTAGSDFVSIIGRTLDSEVINFGFSGCGKGEPEMARLIREVKARMFVLDFQANADVDTLEQVLPEFIRLLREKHPHTPCVITTNPGYNQRLRSAEARSRIDRKRDIGMRVYLDKKAAGDQNLHFIDGYGLLPGGEAGAYVDGVHPTSHGFALMAERLTPQLRSILIQEEFRND